MRIKRDKNRKYILYGHDGSGNHGCEALVRTFAAALGLNPERDVLISCRPEEDIKYNLDRLARVVPAETKGPIKKCSAGFVKAYLALKLQHDCKPMDYMPESCAYGMRRGDVAVCIGGDSYCYGDWASNERIFRNQFYKSAGVKTVLWGASIEPELLENPVLAKDMQRYDLITARESISYKALKSLNANTVLVSDGAFSLPAAEVSLPETFLHYDLVGINSSPLIEDLETSPGIVRRNYLNLLRWILDNTQMKILLIPHVEWVDSNGDTDRTILSDLKEMTGDADRIYLPEDCGCEMWKGYISKCRFFVGTRTHSTIASYSQGIPTLVLGYSVKSRGIAEDLLGTEDNYVLPVQEMTLEDDLRNAFCRLMEHESEIRSRLNGIMPAYRQRYQNGVEALKQL